MHVRVHVAGLALVLLSACASPAPVDSTSPQEAARAHYERGTEHMAARPPRLDEAVAAFQAALAADAMFHRAHFKLGLCRYQQGRYEEEIADYERCLALDPRYAPALLNLGQAHLARGDVERARQTFQRLREVDPTAPVPDLELLEPRDRPPPVDCDPLPPRRDAAG